MTNTTDPAVRSFIPVPESSHFPIQNLPYCIFRPNLHSTPRVGIAIGESILDLSLLESEGFFADVFESPSHIFSTAFLNLFMSKGSQVWHTVRSIVFTLLREDEPKLRDRNELRQQIFTRMDDVYLQIPVDIRGYTDFYSSRQHAVNVGKMFRDEKHALLPNWLHLPVAYHGRASSIVLSGTDIRRPSGQFVSGHTTDPDFSPTKSLDFELEMGFFIGPGNSPGRNIKIDDAEDHIFGLVLVNDWSARDIQKWEYQPLGPFLSKNFATSISPWVIPLEALEPFRCNGPEQIPEPLPYLRSDKKNTYDIRLEVALKSAKMKHFQTISETNFRHVYWSIQQQVTHHSSNGCNLQSGDLLASGTISGPDPSSYGSLLEITWNGTKPLKLSDGSTRKFLEDGDTLVVRGWCEGYGYKLGFGDLIGKILPASE